MVLRTTRTRVRTRSVSGRLREARIQAWHELDAKKAYITVSVAGG